jgi:hypothetical protein
MISPLAEGQFLRGGLHRIPVRILRSPFDVVDVLSGHGERNPQSHQDADGLTRPYAGLRRRHGQADVLSEPTKVVVGHHDPTPITRRGEVRSDS